MKTYNHKDIEAKWQKYWQKEKIYQASNVSKKPKKYVLIEFPYPSGEGLHMGHLRPYTAGDVYSRFWRMKGFETLYPIGWDAFGLPAENYALKNKVHPSVSTAQNIANAKKQLQSWGMGFDWSREINTTDPNYYKWTQWIFLQLFKAGLAYEATGLINWCPKDKTGLANEEVIDGKCERCGTLVEKKEIRQWYLKITAYAEKLLEGLKSLKEWPAPVKLQQENWIGRSQGVMYKQKVKDLGFEIESYDSVPQTFLAQTFCVIAPEHPLVKKLIEGTEYEKPVSAFVEKFHRTKKGFAAENEIEGIFTGRYVDNPFGTGDLPIWIATFVVADYGTGIVNASAHDERDFAFAKKYGIPLRPVMFPKDAALAEKVKNLEICYHHDPDGILQEPKEFTGRKWGEVRDDIISYLEKKGFGYRKINYKLRDWVFSRQRYWGEPIPLIHCDKCGTVPVPENDLPVTLPEVKNYEPTGTGESPLAVIDEWVNVKCPQCGVPAKRETNTMPQWAGSSWYWLRYTDPQNKKELASQKNQKYWTPVDVYFGGMEHTTLHLLYSRFWNLFLYDQGHVTVKEPYTKRVPHGIILASDGEKMSKSRGNVVNPDEIVGKFGADVMRMYELFLGPHDATVSWNDKGIMGVVRFLDRVSKFESSDVPNSSAIHKLIKKISADIESFKFNTSVAAFMEFLNNNEQLSQKDWESFLKLLAPFAPHTTEELWHQLGHKDSIHQQDWPKFDPELAKDTKVIFVVQVSGKLRATLEVDADSDQTVVKKLVLADPNVQKHLEGKQIVKEIFVKDKLINFVVK